MKITEQLLLSILQVQANLTKQDFIDMGFDRAEYLFTVYSTQGHNLISFMFNGLPALDRDKLIEKLNERYTSNSKQVKGPFRIELEVTDLKDGTVSTNAVFEAEMPVSLAYMAFENSAKVLETTTNDLMEQKFILSGLPDTRKDRREWTFRQPLMLCKDLANTPTT